MVPDSEPAEELTRLVRRIEMLTIVAKLARDALAEDGRGWSDPDPPEVVLKWALDEIAATQSEIDSH